LTNAKEILRQFQFDARYFKKNDAYMMAAKYLSGDWSVKPFRERIILYLSKDPKSSNQLIWSLIAVSGILIIAMAQFIGAFAFFILIVIFLLAELRGEIRCPNCGKRVLEKEPTMTLQKMPYPEGRATVPEKCPRCGYDLS
jgi:DNA-directed RNA polymerase subunit RPC12/RpoP